MPGKNEKLAKNTTNKDHFKLWLSLPAQPATEYPEFTSEPINKSYDFN
jgi:hypothetical protein